MFSIGDKIIYGESGVCTVVSIAPLDMAGAPADKLFYYLSPLCGSGTYFAPVDTEVFMRPLISCAEAERLIASIPSIEPAICSDSRFNHVDAFYKELFRLHTPESLVSIIKGLNLRNEDRKTKSTRIDSTLKRAKEILHGELSVALGIDYSEVEAYIASRIQ